MHIADPTLNVSENATLGWYTANKKGNFQNEIAKLISFFRDYLEITELVFLGSSGGGFPAVYYSQVFENSTALLLAPVFNVKESVQDVPRKLFASELNDAETFEEAISKHPDVVFDLRELILDKGGLVNPVNVLQSRKDNRFWSSQTKPLLENLGCIFSAPPPI
ncbi:hypothetical protein JKI95_10020 [Corynebacterium aquatimens]|uniref:hypothetical protein n=1 Tax=Corynebacterium aquatimens TaxID=1190508 RepID=UPI00253FB859|nr:hypothetical protein [Corynebacterium aquatimens]QYH19420.1 hypothetical protein JKI95_10020 [Corynebacterium aquatimens]